MFDLYAKFLYLDSWGHMKASQGKKTYEVLMQMTFK